MEFKTLKEKIGQETLATIIVCIGICFVCQSSTFVRFSSAPSLVLAAYRKSMVTIMLLPFVLKSHREELKHLGGKRFFLCLLSGFFLALHFWTYFESLFHTTIAASQVLCGMEVVFVALFMIGTRKEKFEFMTSLGIAVALIGSVLCAYTGKGNSGQTSLYGNLLALLSGALLATYSLFGSRIRATCSTTLYTFLCYGFSAIVLNIFVLFSDYSYLGYEPVNYLTAFGMAICCSLLGHSIFNWSLKYLSPTYVSMLKIFSPVLAVFWGFVFFREIPLWNQMLGGVFVIAGILIYTSKKEAKKS